MANFTSEDLWGGVYDIGTESDEPIPADVIKQLIAFDLVEPTAIGPKLTRKGERAFVIMESGDGEMPELENFGL